MKLTEVRFLVYEMMIVKRQTLKDSIDHSLKYSNTVVYYWPSIDYHTCVATVWMSTSLSLLYNTEHLSSAIV